MAPTERISIADAEALIEAALTASEVSPANARSVAHALVTAEAEGQVGHGFSRLGDYAAQAKSGKVNGQAQPACLKTAPGVAMIDAGDGFAFPALDHAANWLRDTAPGQGVAAVGIHRSHHCGALSVQVNRLADMGLVGLMVANSPPAMAPWGAKTPIFGTNPIAFAAPRTGQAPLVIDLSLSRVARGKVMNAKKTGQPIPEGWALDADGHPTTDAEAALQGSMLPIGDAKGTALALMVEILAACFTGANASPEVQSFFTADGPPSGAGQFLMAMRPPAGFAERLAALLGLIEGLDGARLPGGRRLTAIARAEADGLDVPLQYLEAARRLADGG